MSKVEKIIKSLQNYVQEKDTLIAYRQEEKDFTRQSKLNFAEIAMLGITPMSGSLSVDLYNSLTMNNLPLVTKSAYSQGRYKIKSDFYSSWNEELLNCVYKQQGRDVVLEKMDLKKWRDYLIEAMDGSKIVLPNSELMRQHFGYQIGGSKKNKSKTAMALLMCRYDVLNNYIKQGELSPLSLGENTVCKNWVRELNSEAITLFDRGFASIFLCYLLLKYNKPFLMRVKLSFNTEVKEFVASGEEDRIVTLRAKQTESTDYETIIKGTEIKVRLVRVVLPNGEIEVLMTSLLDQEMFSATELGVLYNMRWGIETAYDRLKNKFLLMCFTGHKTESIYQDVYATLFVHNLHQLFIQEAQVIINEKVTNCKYNYTVNNSVTIGIIKYKIITLFLTEKPEFIIHQLIQLFSTYREPIRPGRTFKRNKNTNKRKATSTHANYRRN